MKSNPFQSKGYVEIDGELRKVKPVPVAARLDSNPPVEKESDLHDAIINFCFNQHPRWKVLFARADKKSTLPVGVHDLTIYASRGRVFNFELKAKGNKQTTEQLAWQKELQMNGHAVDVLYSFLDFKEVVK